MLLGFFLGTFLKLDSGCFIGIVGGFGDIESGCFFFASFPAMSMIDQKYNSFVLCGPLKPPATNLLIRFAIGTAQVSLQLFSRHNKPQLLGIVRMCVPM
jgi:hypothetical protein